MYIHEVICGTLKTNRTDRLLYIRNIMNRPIGLYCNNIPNIVMIPLIIDDEIIKKDSANDIILRLINEDQINYIKSIVRNGFYIHDLYEISSYVTNTNMTTQYIQAVFNGDV